MSHELLFIESREKAEPEICAGVQVATVDAEETRFGVSGIEGNVTITAPAWRERKRESKGNGSPDEENADGFHVVNILAASSSKALQISYVRDWKGSRAADSRPALREV